MNAPERLKFRKTRAPRARSRKPTPGAAEIARQCRRANAADRRDNWRAFIVLPE